MYKGYILTSNFPTQPLVREFVNTLFYYLFPTIAFEHEYESNQEASRLQLHQQLLQLLVSCPAQTAHQNQTVTHFIENITVVKIQLLQDAEFILSYDPAAFSLEEVIHTYPGFYAIVMYRLANLLYKNNIAILPRMMSEVAHSKTGIDINAGATIGCPFFIDHGTGIVIGETTVIGNSVKIYQGVTLGALVVQKADAEIKRHPTIQDDVVIYSGSTILGGDTIIGSNSIIGGNTWLTSSVPANSVVYHTAQTVIKDRKTFNEPINFII